MNWKGVSGLLYRLAGKPIERFKIAWKKVFVPPLETRYM